jgi:hypothetical protein
MADRADADSGSDCLGPVAGDFIALQLSAEHSRGGSRLQ